MSLTLYELVTDNHEFKSKDSKPRSPIDPRLGIIYLNRKITNKEDRLLE